MSLIDNHVKLLDGLSLHIGKENVIDKKVPRERRVFVTIKKEKLKEAMKYLKEKENFTHISTITALDGGEYLEVIYHLTKKDLNLNLKIKTPHNDPTISSISDIFNGAILYEREIHDLLGVKPEGHPNLKRLELPEDWPEGVHPLLKKWDLESIRKKIDEGG